MLTLTAFISWIKSPETCCFVSVPRRLNSLTYRDLEIQNYSLWRFTFRAALLYMEAEAYFRKYLSAVHKQAECQQCAVIKPSRDDIFEGASFLVAEFCANLAKRPVITWPWNEPQIFQFQICPHHKWVVLIWKIKLNVFIVQEQLQKWFLKIFLWHTKPNNLAIAC